MKLVILGPPGAGKGTLAPIITEITGCKHISTGDMFRKNIKNQTELGRRAEAYMNEGKLVPDSLTIDMVRDTIVNEQNSENFLLDGFPRTVEQAEALDAILAGSAKELDAVICLDVDDEIIIKRLSGRLICTNCGAGYNSNSMPPQVEGICDNCGHELSVRDDDQAETVSKRLKTYHEVTEPLLAYYQRQNKIVKLDGSGTAAETDEAVKIVLQKMMNGENVNFNDFE